MSRHGVGSFPNRGGDGRLVGLNDQRIAGKGRKQCVPGFGFGQFYHSPLSPSKRSETNTIGPFVIVRERVRDSYYISLDILRSE